MIKLKNTLHLEGESPIEMVLGKDGPAIYEQVKQLLKEEAEPVLMEYLSSLNIREKLQEVKSLDVLHKVEVVYITTSFKELICNLLDKYRYNNRGLTLEQKTWLFIAFINSFFQGAAGYITAYFEGRAEQLTNAATNGKIITL